MESFPVDMTEYKKQLEKGVIQRAYKGLMEYLVSLRTHIQRNHPDYAVPGSLYHGYMDMSYFSILPEALKERNLKIAIVFLHEACRFEAWLSGYNKQVQLKYWKLIRESGWDKYHLVSTTKGADSILECVLVEQPDFGDPDGLTKKIERGSVNFIRDVEKFLSRY